MKEYKKREYVKTCLGCGLVELPNGSYNYVDNINREDYNLSHGYLSQRCLSGSMVDLPPNIIKMVKESKTYQLLPTSCLELIVLFPAEKGVQNKKNWE